ncbi:peroxidasin-like, partial [Stylophora pistillata]|uniref:peroxidasin-like n=1 Tax=Stylophora pistillata TaxID=50429 RepID=UPI000C03F5E0
MTKREGENVTLHCNATGNPLPTLSWTKDGSDIANNHRISISEDKKQLAITIANREHRGGYLCVAHNEVGNDSLIIAILDVQYRPEIASHPQIVTKPEGENVTLTCNATGNPEPELLWFKDYEHLERSSNRISLSAGNKSLMIANLNRTNSGKYLCVAQNEVGNATSNIT